MAQIKIYGELTKGCIFFDGSTIEPKFLGTILAESKSDELDRFILYRTDRQDEQGNNRQLFKRMQSSRIQNEAGEDLVNALGYTTADVVAYINEQANLTTSVNPVVDTSLNGVDVSFKLDATSTSIIFDNGYQYGVNTIKAVDTGDGLITIKSIEDARTLFTELDHTNVDIDGVDAVGGLNDVINVLNELFTVGAFESVVISDPYSTMIADVSGVDAGYTLEGADAVDPIGDDIFTYDGSGYANYAGLKSTATINQAGEYYTFDIRGEGTIGFGLIHTQDSFDNGLFSGNSNYANPTNFAAVNSAHYGFQFSHWFHPTPNGSWTNYGANTAYSMRAGWSNFNGTAEQSDWLAGNPIKVRCGIDNNGYISIETLRDGSDWVVHARSGYPVAQGSEYHLGIKSQSTSARVFSAPKVHLLEEVAPTMYFRYIESPDGVFHYPLFTTAAEAEYYDEIHNGLTAGTGSSHTHTYADDPTNTTWYMPEASHDTNTYQHNSAPNGTETFSGNAVTYTEVTSLTNSDLTPTAFSGTDITQEEGTSVNLQVTPAGASWSTSVSISPSGSGLVYDGYSLVQGTLADVGADTTYTITVTRANSYGSTVGAMTITATDVAPIQTNDTPWAKALDFSGSNEHLKQVSTSQGVNAISMAGVAQLVGVPSNTGNTTNVGYGRPFATAIVFNTDKNNSNQHIWNYGQGAANGDDNIYLRQSSGGQLYFGWGREGSGYNEKQIGSVAGGQWYGVYIATTGARFNSTNATAANLDAAFDIRVAYPNDIYNDVGADQYLVTPSGYWTSTGARMDRQIGGEFTIGGRGSNRNFHGKVASMVVTTLKLNQVMPNDAEIKAMVTDPIGWVNDYKVGNEYGHYSSGGNISNFQKNNLASSFATQVWLMGDGTNDSYSNGIRNQVNPTEQNYTKLQLNSMVSNDIETVNINGLT